MTIKVLAAPGAELMASVLAGHLKATLCEVESRRFPDGEIYLRIKDSVQACIVVLVASLREPDPQALSLWFLADAARELGARQVGLVAPYLPYMRQDKRFHAGEAVTSRTFAQFISSRFDWITTVDPHLHRYAALSEIYTVPAEAVASAPAIARWILAEVPKPLIVGPDSESAQWAGDVARRVGCPVIVLDKTRLGDRQVEISVPQAGAREGAHEGAHESSHEGAHQGVYEGRTPVLIDDIISSARTMAVAAGRVRAAFGQAPICVGVHAVFAPDALQVLREAGAQRVVTCNTLPHPTNGIDVGPELAQSVMRLAGV